MSTETIDIAKDSTVVLPAGWQPKEMSDLEREHYEAIKERSAEVTRLLLEWNQLKGDASEAKKEYDNAVSELTYLINRGPDYQRKLEFEDSEDGETLAWRDEPIDANLGLTAKVLEKLEEAGITTIGQLEDRRAGEGLTSIAGIGQATADKIEEQVLEWLDEHRDKFGEVVTEEPDSEDGTDEEETDDDIDI